MTIFEPFQKVLVRESVDEVWEADFYSHYDEGDHYTIAHRPISGNELLSNFLLPYNDETKPLLGTTNAPTPEWEPKAGELVAVKDAKDKEWRARVFRYRNNDNKFVCDNESANHLICSWDFCESLRKHFNLPEE